MNEEWYTEHLYYKITLELPRHYGALRPAVKRLFKLRANQLVLLYLNTPTLGFRERNGKVARCLKKSEVLPALQRLHDTHGHFSSNITFHNVYGRYYWPTRGKDIEEYCRTCTPCQMLGPLRPSAGLLPVLHLQPMDMLGADWMGPISPLSLTGSRYLCVAIDYATRFQWARAYDTADSANTLEFLESIFEVYGNCELLYTDNGSHFVGGVMPDAMKQKKIRHINAPPGHPSSVGLAERTVQMHKVGLQSTLQAGQEFIRLWDKVDRLYVTPAINARRIDTVGYSPNELLLGYQPRRAEESPTVEEEIRQIVLSAAMELGKYEEIQDMTGRDERLARLDEVRRHAQDKRLELAEKNAREPNNTLKKGDLVLLRRYALDRQRGKKLEPRWSGPYKIQKFTNNRRSAVVKGLEEGKSTRQHIDNLKPFYARTEETAEADARLSKTTRRLWKTFEDEESIREKAKMSEPLRPYQGALPPHDPNDTWMDDFLILPDGEEQNPAYWQPRALTLGGGTNAPYPRF